MTKSKILITGGTGSFGLNYIKYLLKLDEYDEIIVFSRDEYKQFNMKNELNDSRLKFILGDVRDYDSINQVLRGVQTIIHSAAYKQLPMLEMNPWEGVKTNVIGSQNVVKAAIENNANRVLLISSDKAVQPINIYGATKLCAEKLFIQANLLGKTKFGVVRYGNVVGSRGSILEKFSEKTKKVKITDKRMTRFWLPLEKSFELVEFALGMDGGEIFVPRMPSMKIVDLFKALAPKAKQEIIGIRPGEKLHEILVTRYEAPRTLMTEKYFIILPVILDKQFGWAGEKLPEGFEFTSDGNDEWLTGDDIKKMLKS